MFNKEDNNQKQAANNNNKTSNDPALTNSFQRILEIISEIWDENQYESEFNI